MQNELSSRAVTGEREAKRKNRRTVFACVLLILCAVFGALLAGGLFFGTSEWRLEIFTRSETVYIIMVLAVLLPLMLLFISISVRARYRDVGKMPKYVCDLAETVFDRLDVYGEDAVLNPSSAEADEEERGEGAPRFYGLRETDERVKEKREVLYNDGIRLEDLCERFRKYCASKLRLYYDITDVRRFVASLSVTQLLIMQGMSGTGKTSLAYAFGEFLQNQSTIVSIQPMWKERTDLIGYYNEFTKRFNETLLLQKMYEANYSKEMYITVLDEMNIARVEYYFAEFLSLLEIPDPEKRYLPVVSDRWENDPKGLVEGQIRLPTNMWFMGTVNNDDSTFAISDKVYDRAMVMNLDYKCEPFECEETYPIRITWKHWEKLVKEAREEYGITDRNLRRIAKLDEYLIEKFRITFGNRIMKQIKGYVPVYIACGGKELDAIDDILSKKVLRKLEAQNPVYVKSMAEPLCEFLDGLFGYDGMAQCKEYLRRLERNA